MYYFARIYAAIVALSCLFCLSACQDEMLVSEGGKGNVDIVARMDGGIITRTCVGNSTDDGMVGILWTPGDCVGVYGTDGTRNALFASTNTGNVPEAIFSGDLKQGEAPAYAYYPYSEDNASADPSAVKGSLKLVQDFDLGSGVLESDYKVGTPTFTSSDGRSYEFTFSHLFSLLKFDIDATGTALEGDHLESIVISLPEGRRLGGDFTFDAASKAVIWTGSADGANVLTMNWSDTPALTDGTSYSGYITCAPDIRQGDEIKVTILTRRFKAEFTRAALADFAANTCYTFPLTLANYAGDMTVTERPAITAFSFEAARNGGKILGTKLVWNGSATRPVESTGEALAVGTDSITGCIPYLYDFKLKPTFAVPSGMTVTVNGAEQVSGESEQDFSNPVTYTVSNGTESRTYVVEVTNSGLPVAVLEHEGGSMNWPEAGLNIRAKNEDWPKNDYFTLYNADGTVDVERALCGARLRGNSTQNFPKKPFALKFDKKVGPQGMPTDKRWELLANWMDRTMLRNAVAQDVAHRTANALPDGLGWNPRGMNVELVINGRHVGNYSLIEKVKIDADRIDIRDCYEDVVDDGNANPTVADCGYLLEFDDAMDEVNCFRTGRGLPVMFKDEVPANGDIFNAVKAKVESIEANLEAGDYEAAYELLDINSVIDYFLVQELTFNNEYKHPKSVYMYMDGDGKLTAGPVWDFDWQTFIIPDQVRAYGGNYVDQLRNVDEWLYGGSKLAERTFPIFWEYDYANDMPYMWYPLLFKDAAFRSKVQERWNSIYPVLLQVSDEIDRLAEQNRVSDRFNSAMWPTTRDLKNTVGAAFNGDEEMSFDEAIQSMKKAYADRLEWMNTQIVSGSFVTDAE